MIVPYGEMGQLNAGNEALLSANGLNPDTRLHAACGKNARLNGAESLQ